MTVLTTRAVAQTIAALTSRVRDAVADPANNNTVQRWTDAQIRFAMDGMLAQMYNELSSDDVSSFKASVDISYTANARQVDIPVAVNPQSLYQVEDVDDTSSPLFYDWMDTIDLERFNIRRGWTLVGPAVAIRPIPTQTKNIRLWYVAPFIRASDAGTPGTDQHPMLINHEELIVLGTAIRLQETDDEIPASRVTRFDNLWEQFKSSAARYRGPQYVRSTRSYR